MAFGRCDVLLNHRLISAKDGFGGSFMLRGSLFEPPLPLCQFFAGAVARLVEIQDAERGLRLGVALLRGFFVPAHRRGDVGAVAEGEALCLAELRGGIAAFCPGGGIAVGGKRGRQCGGKDQGEEEGEVLAHGVALVVRGADCSVIPFLCQPVARGHRECSWEGYTLR